jgi:hypothetical protein
MKKAKRKAKATIKKVKVAAARKTVKVLAARKTVKVLVARKKAKVLVARKTVKAVAAMTRKTKTRKAVVVKVLAAVTRKIKTQKAVVANPLRNALTKRIESPHMCGLFCMERQKITTEYLWFRCYINDLTTRKTDQWQQQ